MQGPSVPSWRCGWFVAAGLWTRTYIAALVADDGLIVVLYVLLLGLSLFFSRGGIFLK